MQIFTMLSQKGGTGRSTLAIGLAVESTIAERPTVILDLDEQECCAKWAKLRVEGSEPFVVKVSPERLETTLEACRQSDIERVIIDTPAGALPMNIKAAQVADLVLVPCTPSGQDVAGVSGTFRMLEQANKAGTVVLNRGERGNPSISDARAGLENAGRTVCPVVVHKRLAHNKAYERGYGIAEYQPRSTARDEIRQLEKWITNWKDA